MAENVKASLLGCALGDAYGGAFARSEMPMRGARWTISADTQQMLATCEALLKAGEVNADAIATQMQVWYRKSALSNPGPATLMALVEMTGGKNWRETGQRGTPALTNEAITRLAPLAFLLDPITPSGMTLLREVCSITHESEPAVEAALAVLLAIRFIRNDQQSGVQPLIKLLPEGALKDRFVAISKRGDISVRDIGRHFGASGNVVDSIPLAVFASRRVIDQGFATMMKELVSAGGEMRSNCAIGGLIAGYWCGMEGIPKDWQDKLFDNPGWERNLEIANAFDRMVEGMSGVQRLF